MSRKHRCATITSLARLEFSVVPCPALLQDAASSKNTMTDSSIHSFAICAHKECEFLDEAVASVVAQTRPSPAFISTSTPNAYIESIAKKYNLPLIVNSGPGGLRNDWNFAYDHATTPWVTIVHQDDRYAPEYAQAFHDTIARYPDPVAFTTGYRPLRDGRLAPLDRNARFKRIFRFPLRFPRLAASRFWKQAVLAFGNSFCCPSLAYNRERLGPTLFDGDMVCCLDWHNYLKIARGGGSIAYNPRPLVHYRIHAGAGTVDSIATHAREREDARMLAEFWPRPLVPLLLHFYKSAYSVYDKL